MGPTSPMWICETMRAKPSAPLPRAVTPSAGGSPETPLNAPEAKVSAMSFDARSKQRLEALGRTLPKKIEPPASPTEAPNAAPRTAGVRSRSGEAGRHRLEREEDPAALFRALMTASPDGRVPPHLLDRLRELEGSRRPAPAGESPTPAPARGSKSGSPKRSSRRTDRRASDDQDLYTAFAQLLLEDEESP